MCGYTKETFIPKVKVALDMSLSSQLEARKRFDIEDRPFLEGKSKDELILIIQRFHLAFERKLLEVIE